MKYYDKLPENFLLIRLVATRFCNYRCSYCYVPLEKRTVKKTMFSHHNWDEWLQALKDNFSDKNLEFYFTGGEPLIIEDCVLLIKELVEIDNVSRIRIDTNLSAVENFLKNLDSEKVRFLTAFHPTQISLDRYLGKVRKVQEKKMVDAVNFVTSKENLGLVNMSPHKLIKVFEDIGIFLNIAKDFHRGLSKGWDYNPNYQKYVDMLQYPLDNYYMNLYSLNKGFLCGGGGRHYISINRHGQVFSCGGKIARTVGYGNIFDKSLNLPDSLHVCEEDYCPSIISYSFSCSNVFLPIDHIKGYAERCSEIREGIPEEYLENLWKKIDINSIIVRKNKKSFPEKIKRIKHNLLKNRNA
ncbi:MAG: radical SAM protein [candidate division Zixibacteria bacterium]|nr:radical SAM protein [candidate division Zixibacteria bacterium]